MVLSIGLVISLAFTTFLCVLLFLYIRQKTSNVERKINSLFQLVQEEVNKINNQPRQMVGGNKQEMTVSEVLQDNDENNNDLDGDIESDVDSDCESDDDSDSNDDSGSDDDNDDNDDDLISVSTGPEENVEDIKVIQHIQIEEVGQDDLEKHTFESIKKDDEQLSDVESLGLVEDEEKDDTQQGDDIQPENSKEINHSPLDNGNPIDIVDVNKLSANKLRSLVETKKLHDNPKKLKKTELIKLLQG